jgi:intron-binding protein aquarius
MVVMLNEKFRENVPAWEGFTAYPDHIPTFFQKLFEMDLEGLRMHERVSFLVFFIHAFQSLENDAVSKQVLRLVQLPLWHSLSPGRLQVPPPSHHKCGD